VSGPDGSVAESKAVSRSSAVVSNSKVHDIESGVPGVMLML
jgi:hypothetical protein